MTTKPASYRWDSSEAAEAYDAAAPAIHPFYEQVQEEILSLLPFGAEEVFELVDLGGGSGRLAERVLERFAGAGDGGGSVGSVLGAGRTAVGSIRSAGEGGAKSAARVGLAVAEFLRNSIAFRRNATTWRPM